MPDTVLTLRPDLAAALDELARETGSSPTTLAEEAVARFLDHERWAIAHIREGLREADAGEFAEEDEVERVFGKYQAHLHRE